MTARENLCTGRVAIVTGAGRGLGRAHALMLARHGARVVVNNRPRPAGDAATGPTPAEQVVEQILAEGGEAILDNADVTQWDQAAAMIERAVTHFGRLDVLVNNAGGVRDRMLTNMSEEDWDSVITGHLKGTFAPTHHAANYWRDQAKKGAAVTARVINTTSHSGLFGNIGQANYAAAKGGIAAFTLVAARELQRYGVTVNAIAPIGLTRINAHLLGDGDDIRQLYDPDWVAALVVWLASNESAAISGRVFEAWGAGYAVAESWEHGPLTAATKDPTTLNAAIHEIHQLARKNAGLERGTWLNP